jgi:hypothetical protein
LAVIYFLLNWSRDSQILWGIPIFEYNNGTVFLDVCYPYLEKTHDEKDKHYTVPNIFLNHGDNYARETLKNAIYSHRDALQEQYDDTNLYQTNVEIPKLDNKCYDLDRQCWIDNDIDSE